MDAGVICHNTPLRRLDFSAIPAHVKRRELRTAPPAAALAMLPRTISTFQQALAAALRV
jgi:hypothetical protein